jgi:hypothetical protein
LDFKLVLSLFLYNYEAVIMNKLSSVISFAALALISNSAYAIAVPEIDGSNAAIGIGLTVAAVALVKEFCRKK